jgi:hypothetical protein
MDEESRLQPEVIEVLDRDHRNLMWERSAAWNRRLHFAASGVSYDQYMLGWKVLSRCL